MAGAQASITVVGGSRREDYVLPVGMTIAGLLALIEVDLTSLQARLTLGGGRAVDPSDVIGRGYSLRLGRDDRRVAGVGPGYRGRSPGLE